MRSTGPNSGFGFRKRWHDMRSELSWLKNSCRLSGLRGNIKPRGSSYNDALVLLVSPKPLIRNGMDGNGVPSTRSEKVGHRPAGGDGRELGGGLGRIVSSSSATRIGPEGYGKWRGRGKCADEERKRRLLVVDHAMRAPLPSPPSWSSPFANAGGGGAVGSHQPPPQRSCAFIITLYPSFSLILSVASISHHLLPLSFFFSSDGR